MCAYLAKHTSLLQSNGILFATTAGRKLCDFFSGPSLVGQFVVALFVISSLHYFSLFRNVNLIAEIFDTPQKTGKVLMCDKMAEIEKFTTSGHIESAEIFSFNNYDFNRVNDFVKSQKDSQLVKGLSSANIINSKISYRFSKIMRDSYLNFLHWYPFEMNQ